MKIIFSSIFSLEAVYMVTGLFVVLFGIWTFLDKKNSKRFPTGLFWILYGITFIFGNYLPYAVTGILVILISILAGFNLLGHGQYHESNLSHKENGASKYHYWLFLPIIFIPLFSFGFKLFGLSALIGMGIGSIVGLIIIMGMTKTKPIIAIQEGRRLSDAIGWAIILSQFLAALGYLFGKGKIGDIISHLVTNVIPSDNRLFSVLSYTIGMWVFTAIMGNAFAAFAVMTLGIGIPLVIVANHGDPAIVGVLGMLAGYCGTLMTPMAANFNIVPAALLEMDNKNTVIKLQFPIGVALFISINILMYTFAF